MLSFLITIFFTCRSLLCVRSLLVHYTFFTHSLCIIDLSTIFSFSNLIYLTSYQEYILIHHTLVSYSEVFTIILYSIHISYEDLFVHKALSKRIHALAYIYHGQHIFSDLPIVNLFVLT